MEKFMYIFRGGDVSYLSPAEQQAQMQKWLDWVNKLSADNRYVAGEPLLPEGKTLSGKSKTLTDGPFVESKELVGGFFIVNARDLNEATELAKDCPDFSLGGIVEVRPVMKLEM
jgi:hypothetical protein